MFVPITPPLNLLAAQLEKIPSVTRFPLSIFETVSYFRRWVLR